MQLSDTAAIVTGGASGARALAGAGATVLAVDLPAAVSMLDPASRSSVDKAEQVDRITYYPADVTDAEQVQAAVDTAARVGRPAAQR